MTIPTIVRFHATVDGVQRYADIPATDLPDWARPTEWEDGEMEDDQLEAIQTHVMNTEPLYRAFYESAEPADFDRPLKSIDAEAITS